MATKLPAVLLADFTTQLASEMAIGATTATLSSNIDDDSVTIPDGVIYLTIDGANSGKEHIQAVKTGANLASIMSVSRQGVLTSGVLRKHRIGASVAMTDFATIKYLNDLLRGNTNLDSSVPLQYDGTASISTANQLATKNYVDATAVAGAPNASTTVKGIVELATQAETDARTTTGGTGALLVNSTDTQRSTLLSDGVDEIGVVATVTIATPGVVTFTAHGLVANDTVQFTTTGALPTGLAINTTYYVIATGLTANTFQISATLGGSAINTTGTQSGVHSLFRSNQYVFNTPVATTALGAFKEFSFRAKNANTTTSPTVIVNGLTPRNIRKLNGATSLAAGDIGAGQIVKGTDDGTNFQMVSPVANTVSLVAGVYPAGSAANLTNLPTGARNGSVTISGNGTTTITTTFQPKHISLSHTGSNGGGSGISMGGYDSTSNTMWCCYTTYNANGGIVAASNSIAKALHAEWGTNPTATTATITNVTSTSFDIVATFGTVTAVVFWTATT